jgi:hypothetical protein
MPRSTNDVTAHLGDAGLVAFTPCGHWWVYPVHADPEQLQELARFNLGIACSFCLAEQAPTLPVVLGLDTRTN